MSKRVAVRNNGDTVEKIAFLAPLASAAMGTVGRAAATKIGQTALGQGAKSMAGKLAESKVGQMAGKVASKAKDVLGEDAGKKIGEAGAAMAQMQQQKQQAMQQQNQQMAEKAKAGSQINTGEAMDMSWQMLKAWSFVPGFDAFDKELVINHAKKRKLKHVSNNDLGHHDVRFNQRYKPDQEMPKGAEKLTPRDLALAYMDLMLRRNPELLNQANTKMPARDKSKPDNFPGLTFPLLQTDEPIRSTHEGDNGKMMEAYHPVFATGHHHHESSEHPKAALVTAFDSPTGSTDRAHMPVTHVPNMYSHDFYDIGDEAARQAHYDKADAPVGVSQVARNRQIVAEEAQRRHEGDFMQPIDVERMKQQGLGRSMTEQQATQRVLGANPLAVSYQNPLLAFPQSKLRQEYQQYLAQQQAQQQKEEAQAAVPRIQPAGNGFVFFNGQLMREEDVPVETGEPMDMAWRMLKGELHLPHQITEALRGDLTTLDRAHKMTDTNEGTLIENIHPDMENVVKLLAEKHMGDISPTMQRPVMPLFHSPFH